MTNEHRTMTPGQLFGEYLREKRDKLGMDVITVARESGISRAFLYHLEAGSKGIPSLHTIFLLARTYRIPLAEIVDKALSLTVEDERHTNRRRGSFESTDVLREADMIYGKYERLNAKNKDMLTLFADYLYQYEKREGRLRD